MVLGQQIWLRKWLQCRHRTGTQDAWLMQISLFVPRLSGSGCPPNQCNLLLVGKRCSSGPCSGVQLFQLSLKCLILEKEGRKASRMASKPRRPEASLGRMGSPEGEKMPPEVWSKGGFLHTKDSMPGLTPRCACPEKAPAKTTPLLVGSQGVGKVLRSRLLSGERESLTLRQLLQLRRH